MTAISKQKKIFVVAGARPNFMKVNLLVKKLKTVKRFRTFLVHTGQHYDFKMSEIFFQDLRMPKPDYHLNADAGPNASQTGSIMAAFEALVLKKMPDLVIVVGDVNSTLACSLVAAKLGIQIAHVEAGLRSFDIGMPEEVNRMVTDAVSDLLFVSERSGLVNLKNEGMAGHKVHFVGNTMIDSLLESRRFIDRSKILDRLELNRIDYGVLTLHRPSNVDSREALLEIHKILKQACGRMKIVYPIHPRARQMMTRFGLTNKFKSIKDLMVIEPLGYIDFIKLVKGSSFVLTDSGGIQEETTVLKIPCLTMRQSTERPITVKEGSNILVGRDLRKIDQQLSRITRGSLKKSRIPKFWDGNTCTRIVGIIKKAL